MEEYELYIDTDGTIQTIYDDALVPALAAQGKAETRRASHVEPTVLQLLGVQGWVADMSPVGGPVLVDGDRPFATRQAALDAERLWLRAHMAHGRL